MSLIVRLNLLVTILTTLLIFAVGAVLIDGTRDSIQEGVEAATRVTTQLLDTVIVGSVQNPELGNTHEVLERFLISLGHVRGNDIRLYAAYGKLVYQSPASKYHIEVLPPAWFVKWLSPHEKTVVRYIRFGRLEIIPDPSGAIREAWVKISKLFWILLTFFMLLNIAVYGVLVWWLQPLKSMLRAIRRMELSDLSVRLPKFSVPEFTRIGDSLNRMAQSLTAERALEENRELTREIQRHIEDERRSLARELHDELGQYVTAIKTFGVTIANQAQQTSPQIARQALAIVSVANQIYDGMHDIIRKLRPGTLDHLGLIDTLRDAVENWQKQNPTVEIHLLFEEHDHLHKLGETININVYRIVQEAINNAIKHAKASRIQIELSIVQSMLKLHIHDDGVGMQQDWVSQQQHDHFGLLGIRERVQALLGQFELRSSPNCGTHIEVSIPLTKGMGRETD